MDELNITPQPSGDQPEKPAGEEGQMPAPAQGGGEGKSKAPAEGEGESSFQLNTEQKSDTSPINLGGNLLEASQGEAKPTEAPSPLGEQINPAQIETPSPQGEASPVEQPPLSGAAQGAPSEPPSMEETPLSEAPQEPAGEVAEKKGLPKGALVTAGVLALVVVAGAALYFTNTWPFGAQAPEIAEEFKAEFRAVAPEEGAAPEEAIVTEEAATPEERLVTEEVAVIAPVCGENQEVDPDSNQCICSAGYFELEMEPSSYSALSTSGTATYLYTDTYGNVQDQPGSTNIALFDTADLYRDTSMTDNIALLDTGNIALLDTGDQRINSATAPTIECINCQELNDRIQVLKQRLEELPALDIDDVTRANREAMLNTEIARLEAKAEQEGCLETRDVTPEREVAIVPTEEKTCDELVSEITRLQSIPTAATTPEIAQELAMLVTTAERQECELPEKNACTQLEEDAVDQIALGNFAESYNRQLSYIDAACVGELNPCGKKIAYATVAKEYRDISKAPADLDFFEEEFTVRRTDFMDDLSCVPDKSLRCTDIESKMDAGMSFDEKGALVDGETVPGAAPLNVLALDETRSEILTLDEPTFDASVLALDDMLSSQTGILNQSNLNAEIQKNIRDLSVLTDQEYFELYCQPFVPYIGDYIPPSGEGAPAQPPVSPGPAAPQPPAEEAAAMPPASGPIVTPPSPPSDVAAAIPAESEILAPAPPPEAGLLAGEAEFRPAAPEAPPAVEAITAPEIQPLKEAAEITESPEITKTGPEAYIFFFLFVASQVIFFRRRIYAFIENRQ